MWRYQYQSGLSMPDSRSFLLFLLILFLSCTSVGATTLEGIVVTEQGLLDGAVVKAYPSLQDAITVRIPLSSAPGAISGFFNLDLPP